MYKKLPAIYMYNYLNEQLLPQSKRNLADSKY